MKIGNFGSNFFLKEQIIKESFTDRCVHTHAGHTHTHTFIYLESFVVFCFKPTDKLLIALGSGFN